MATGPVPYHFVAGDIGHWTIVSNATLRGDGLADAARLAILSGNATPPDQPIWLLRGVGSHMRYTTADEARQLAARQEGLGRAAAVHAALIPIRKSSAWWALAQDERRAIYEEQSRHTSLGMDYLPQIARRLHHSRDLGEPFDFLTWFEFAPSDEPAFDALLEKMRASPEWDYVDREIDLRLRRE